MSKHGNTSLEPQGGDISSDEPLTSHSCPKFFHIGLGDSTDISWGEMFVAADLSQVTAGKHESLHLQCVTKAMTLGWLYHRGELTDETEIDKCGETSITLKNIEQVSGGELKKENILALAERMSKVTKLQAAFADVEGQWEMLEPLSFSDRLTDEVRDSMTAEDMVKEWEKCRRAYLESWDGAT